MVARKRTSFPGTGGHRAGHKNTYPFVGGQCLNRTIDKIWWMSLSQVSLEIAWMNFGFTWLLTIGSISRRLQRQKRCAHRNVTMQWTVRWKSLKPRRVPLSVIGCVKLVVVTIDQSWFNKSLEIEPKLSRFWHSHNSPLPTCKRLSKRKKLLQKKPKDASDLDALWQGNRWCQLQTRHTSVTSVIMCGIRLGYLLNAAANQNQTTSVAAIRYLQQLMAEEVTGSRMEQFKTFSRVVEASCDVHNRWVWPAQNPFEPTTWQSNGSNHRWLTIFEPQMIDDLHRKPTNLGVQDGPRLLAMSRCELCSIQALQYRRLVVYSKKIETS